MSNVKYRPRARWWIAPAVLLLVVTPLISIPAVIQLVEMFKHDATIAADGRDHAVKFDEPGDRMLFADVYEAERPPECEVSSVEGTRTLEEPPGTFTVNEWQAFAVVSTSADEIVVNCQSEQNLEVRVAPAIGVDDFFTGFGSMAAAILVGTGAVVWLTILFALTLARPRRPV